MALTMATVQFDFRSASSSTLATGYVYFSCPYDLYDTTGHILWGKGTKSATITAGVGSISVPVNNGAGISPSGWAWSVTVDTDVVKRHDDWLLTSAMGSPVNFADTPPAVTPPTVTTYALDAALTAEIAARVAGDLAAVHKTGTETVAGDKTLTGTTVLQGSGKAYRLRNTGGGLDLEGGGAPLVISVWSNADFTGTQRLYVQVVQDSQLGRLLGRWIWATGYDGASTILDVDPNVPGIGFYGATALSKRTVTGSRGGNAALASLLTALSQLGLITDSTTA